MRCAEVAAAVRERAAGRRLAAAATEALEGHFRSCTACAALERGERELTAALARLRVEPPFAIDVAARVGRTVAAWGRRSPTEVGERTLAAASAVAALAALAAGTGLLLEAPRVARFVRGAATLVGAALRPVEAVARAMAHVAAIGLSAVRETAASVGAAALGAEPALWALVAAAHAAIAVTIVLVVARDLRAGATLGENRP